MVLTVPAGKGITHVALKAGAMWNGDVAVGSVRSLSFRKSYARPYPSLDNQWEVSDNQSMIVSITSYPLEVEGGEEFSLGVFQNTGNNVEISTSVGRTWFSIEDVTPRGVLVSGTGGGAGAVGYEQAFTDETSVSVTHNIGSLIHTITVLDSSNNVVDATVQFGENTDTVTFSESMTGTVVVIG